MQLSCHPWRLGSGIHARNDEFGACRWARHPVRKCKDEQIRATQDAKAEIGGIQPQGGGANLLHQASRSIRQY